MNWIDLIIILILIYFACDGIKRYWVNESYDLLSFIIAFLVSLQFYHLTAHFLETTFTLPRSLANVLGFVLLWYLIESIFFISSRLILFRSLPVFKFRGSKFIGVIPSLLRGIVFVSIMLILVGTFPIQPKIKKQVQTSRIGSWMLDRTYQLQKPLNGIFGDLAQDSITFLTVKPKTDESVDLGFKTDKYYFDASMEREMIGLVNKERTLNGLKSLEYNPKLQEIARGHSADMLKRGYFSHHSPEGKSVVDRADEAKIEYLVIGENLAYAPNLEIAHSGLMNSPGHRANILSEDYHQIGIGIANANEYGIMFTQVFSN